MFKNPGTKWPIIIAISIIGVIGLGIGTIKKAIDNPVEMSNYGMQGYHTYDDDANVIINAKIAFDQKYSIAFLTPQVSEKATVIVYKVIDKEGKAVNDATINAVLTRPDTTKLDINLSNPTISDGQYTFNAVDLPAHGRWDVLAKVSIGADQRYYNIKTDTRKSETTEF